MIAIVRLLLAAAFVRKLHGKILRLPCYTDADFVIFYPGRRLIGSVLATYYQTDDIQCTIECASNQKCRSYNINRLGKICEINGEYVSGNSSKLRRESEWLYKSTDYNRTLIGPVCIQLKPCESGVLCQQTCSAPYYECVYCGKKFAGLHCDIPTEYHDCASRPCVNADQCIDKVNDYECKCRNGYTGKNCETDIDECDSLPCFNGGTCRNLSGMYECICAPGILGTNCEQDIDECTTATHNCHANAICSNIFGSFACACMSGYEGDGKTCSDIDECTTAAHSCHAKGLCLNTPGSFSCACITGYQGDGITCSDIDECTTAAHNCHGHALCSNTLGSFTCACMTGFLGDGSICADIDECTTAVHSCHANALCLNSPGSFTCTCMTGYQGDGSTCSDIDECTTAAHNCHGHALCSNTLGSFTCACMTGFLGDGSICADIDECTTATHTCHANALCSNIPGSFTCACSNGYRGDGQTCSENIAYKRNSLQSSLHSHSGIQLYASFGNDGNRNGDWKVCAWTKNLDNPSWWRVDLGRIALVKYIIIRSGSTFDQLKINPFHVSIGNDQSTGGTNNPKCVSHGSVTSGEVKKFTCPIPMLGRYVTVFVDRNLHLQVCELEVYE